MTLGYHLYHALAGSRHVHSTLGYRAFGLTALALCVLVWSACAGRGSSRPDPAQSTQVDAVGDFRHHEQRLLSDNQQLPGRPPDLPTFTADPRPPFDPSSGPAVGTWSPPAAAVGAANSRTQLAGFPIPPPGPGPPPVAHGLLQTSYTAQAPPGNVAPPVSAAPPEAMPPPAADRGPTRLPVGRRLPEDQVRLTRNQDLISLTAREAPLSVVLSMIAEQHGLNIVAGEAIDQTLTVTLNNVPLENALDAILSVHGYVWSRQNNIVVVSPLTGEKTAPGVQGRLVKVFTLNYVVATEINKVVQGLLSPVGQSFTTETSPQDQRRTFEQIVVEDLPSYVERIERYIQQVDIPPRQVVVEAHILQVNLKDDLKHGVNFTNLLRIAHTPVTLEAEGFAKEAGPVSMLRVQGTDLNLLIEAIKGTTDTKTLASPKVAVLNGQEARMQVGGQIGYLLTTTTQTSTMQSVDFLDIGVILLVTPIITQDNRVLLQVKPQVSTGRINATTQLPESETTEVETRVLLNDGEAIVLGGLIKEMDNESHNKIPFLGDLWLVGRLFQRRETTRERNEIIITLLPRILPEYPEVLAEDCHQIQQAGTPLFCGPLQRVDRSAWEPRLPDRRGPYLPPPPR